MFSHITVGCTDLPRAAAFYDALLAPLGLKRRPVTPDGGPEAACWVVPGQVLPRFYVYIPLDGEPASAGNGSMVAFSAASAEAVNAAHEAGLREVRLIHGRGIGVQRGIVQRALEVHPLVTEFWDAPESHLGATVARLRDV